MKADLNKRRGVRFIMLASSSVPHRLPSSLAPGIQDETSRDLSGG